MITFSGATIKEPHICNQFFKTENAAFLIISLVYMLQWSHKLCDFLGMKFIGKTKLAYIANRVRMSALGGVWSCWPCLRRPELVPSEKLKVEISQCQ